MFLFEEKHLAQLEAACSNQEFVSIVYQTALLSTNLNPHWKLAHLRKFLSLLFSFEENAILREFVASELDTEASQVAAPTDQEVADKPTTTTKKLSPTSSLKFSKNSSKTPIATTTTTMYSCEDLKLTADKQVYILGISESSNSNMFKAHELFANDDEDNINEAENWISASSLSSKNKLSLALLENCNEKLAKFEANSVSIPKTTTSGGQTNPLAKTTNSKSMNEAIKSTFRLISNAVIVLMSREMLVQLIKISHVTLLIPPPVTSLPVVSSNRRHHHHHHQHQQPQYEFELLQMLDILYHTAENLRTFKSIVRSLLSNRQQSSNCDSRRVGFSRAIVARIACANIMPEFKLIKRESWSSSEQEKQQHRVGRVRRVRSSASASVEEAVQLGNGSGGSTNVGGVVAGGGLSFLKLQPTTSDEHGGGGDGLVGQETTTSSFRPSDIEQLTQPDASNLLVIFDLNSNKSANTKPSIDIEILKKYF